MAYYLGIDAGGSKTYALLSDEHGHILGKGRSGNGNHQTGAEQAAFSIREAASAALAESGLRLDQVRHTYLGLAGADRKTDYDILHPMIQGIGFTRYTINGDTMIGLRAGTDRPYGVALICGTGTNAAGRNRQGRHYQCGGFDYMYGDFGGGGALNVEVFRTVIRAWDGREAATLLTAPLLELLGYEQVEDMYNDFLDHGKGVPLDAARLLFPAAAEGDAAALAILHRQGMELGKSASAVIHRLDMEQEVFDVVLAGSLLTRGDQGWITSPIRQAVIEAAPGAAIVTLSTEPVVGALWSALESDGITISNDIYGQMRTYQEFEHIPTTTRQE
ncbi:BadF/BadG/BcrA/BcrD ATPase family protein [Paenibacillus sp. MMS20-IR301]|uniref:N-acetylglucosamine kinase n=1 Tax=Paenibacillus sp. MMS20-IR301 TaxID=2895946 RepID=UPI0028EF8C77|nr:BadF/BadG/BcrA/BcrD ATPase family protein [Paenibacillus sp. MMS20-IR301]WNS41990.1 BadF/BadG/BcrA/BcrD ATPase family protein [Paenibacillus sp. MMS20-IR301]